MGLEVNKEVLNKVKGPSRKTISLKGIQEKVVGDEIVSFLKIQQEEKFLSLSTKGSIIGRSQRKDIVKPVSAFNETFLLGEKDRPQPVSKDIVEQS